MSLYVENIFLVGCIVGCIGAAVIKAGERILLLSICTLTVSWKQ